MRIVVDNTDDAHNPAGRLVPEVTTTTAVSMSMRSSTG